jgi:sialate O-acetylesterase
MFFRNTISLLMSLACSTGLYAEVRLPALFSDHAVLQRGQPIHVWGEASPNEAVVVRFHGQSVSGEADNLGHWEVWLKPESAGGPFTLSVQGAQDSKPLERSDILVGDVWLASGQSNMEFPLAGFTNAPLLHGDEEIAHANQPTLRLLIQPRRVSSAVQSDTNAAWTLCTPETARKFSAVAYFFGREISGAEHVPVGLIDTTWGGTPAQSWLSLDGISKFNLTSVMADAARVARDQGRADGLRAEFDAEDAANKVAGREPAQHPRLAGDHQGSWAPASLFNVMIAPFTRYTIKGALWYQGETDTTPERAPNYSRVFSALIQDWRTQWGEGPFPFLFVQLSSFSQNNIGWPTVRDEQRRVAEELAHTGMAVTLDVGLTDNVHPPDKQTVAHRLALLARASAYGEAISAESPALSRATAEQGQVRVLLSHADGLRSKSDEPGDFEVAGDDEHFVPAAATLDGSTLLVHSPTVLKPRFVRYGWKGTVTNWIVNAAGLPLGTFTAEVR